MNDAQLAKLSEGQHLFQPSSLAYGAYISEVIYLGRTKAGKSRIGSVRERMFDSTWHVTDRDMLRGYFTTRPEAAQVLVKRAMREAAEAQENLEAARALLSEVR